MSRRRARHQPWPFGQVILQCPHKHPLGGIVSDGLGAIVSDRTELWYIERPIVPRKVVVCDGGRRSRGEPWRWLYHRSPGWAYRPKGWTPLPGGQKISLGCEACRQAGRRPDYQASWAKVAELLSIDMRDHFSWGQVLTLT
jgi:hypothetical protein